MTDISSRGRRRSAAYSCFGAFLVLVTAVAVLIAMNSTAGAAVTPVNLGTAGSFGVLAGTTVTNTDTPTIVVNGDVGVSPGTAVTGFPPGQVIGGTIQVGPSSLAAGAQSDLTTAYNIAAGESPSTTVGMTIGTGETLVAGVYNSTSSLEVSGSLTLSGQGMFVFQAASTLLADTGSSINFINGASACDVFWQVGSSATIQTGAAFAGNILALTSITVDTGDTWVQDLQGCFPEVRMSLDELAEWHTALDRLADETAHETMGVSKRNSSRHEPFGQVDGGERRPTHPK